MNAGNVLFLTEIALIKFSSKGDCTQQWNRNLAPNAVAAVDDDMLLTVEVLWI